MASNVSTVDGMGFEEVNQPTSTETISGTNVYATTGSFSAVDIDQDLLVGDSVECRTLQVNDREVFSTSYQNTADVYGMRVRAGSVLIGDDSSGLIAFADDWVEGGNYFMTLTPQNWTLPVASNTSGTGFAISGIRRASGCWAYGPSGTVADWIAVGI